VLNHHKEHPANKVINRCGRKCDGVELNIVQGSDTLATVPARVVAENTSLGLKDDFVCCLSNYNSLVAQGCERIDASGAVRGNPTRKKGNRGEQANDNREG
jgi:hypothetical protein